ncbi:hypothetical protein A2907_00980 [Candidatus Azambacteria bacterium RIFCSPLOWO2_01_FULL_37_9]|uniref:Uncharacterized protein n=1 Tax=Candidatus Azambacteria bacterium RIFCSPLOWO2_01_FULL_37_9 TaxID=1797297 RepID=A0A1F5C653_9BACT|nr:MAG: hypothetical protein A2907_00980 [Candidatus Azambacteria bacterium RIFCSPLOWO2_01_FULL_37_9]
MSVPMTTPNTIANPPINSISRPCLILLVCENFALIAPRTKRAIKEKRMDSLKAAVKLKNK